MLCKRFLLEEKARAYELTYLGRETAYRGVRWYRVPDSYYVHQEKICITSTIFHSTDKGDGSASATGSTAASGITASGYAAETTPVVEKWPNTHIPAQQMT